MSETVPVLSWTFAARLAELRCQRGLSQYALARRSGLSRQAISRLELGERPNPPWSTIQRLALALEVTTDALRDPGFALGPDPGPGKAGRPSKRSTEPESTASAADH